MKRLLAFPLVRLLSIVLLFALLATPVVFAARELHGAWVGVAVTWILALLLLAATMLVERLTRGGDLSDVGFGPRHAGRDLVAGAAIGALLFSLVGLELFLGGYYRVLEVHPTPDLALAALLLGGGAAFEELLFRGVVFRLVEEWTGTWIALAVSAVLFGLAHAANPGATPVSSLAIALEAGVLLGAAYVLARNLWLPIGLHFAWNFFEGPVFGTQVSGHSFLRDAVTSQLLGPSWITGGSFGPEAGLPAIITCLIAAALLLFAAWRRSEIAPPSWRKRGTRVKA
jgi:CAAX protease family protein